MFLQDMRTHFFLLRKMGKRKNEELDRKNNRWDLQGRDISSDDGQIKVKNKISISWPVQEGSEWREKESWTYCRVILLTDKGHRKWRKKGTKKWRMIKLTSSRNFLMLSPFLPIILPTSFPCMMRRMVRVTAGPPFVSIIAFDDGSSIFITVSFVFLVSCLTVMQSM